MVDKFTRKTTPEERAMDYARGVKYVGGEIQLAMQAAVEMAFIEGRKDAIEEARREQPVSDAVQAVEALSVMYDEYGGKVPADVLRAILDNFERNAPARREQPVRVTDEALEPIEGVKERLREVARFLYALDTDNSLAARKEVLYGIQTIADQEIILKAHGKEIAYLFEKLALTGDELAALAAAPKEQPQVVGVVGGAVGERFRDFLGVPRKVSSSCALCGCPPNFDIHDPHFGGTHSYLAAAPKEGTDG